jgi:hypothetical protein
MASSTTTREPATGDRERMDGAHQQQTVAPGWYPDP